MRKAVSLVCLAISCGGSVTGAPADLRTPKPEPNALESASAQPPERGSSGSQTPGGANPNRTTRLHSRCGWIGSGDFIGEASFVANVVSFDAVHPQWYGLQPDGYSIRTFSHADIDTVVTAAAANNVRLIPLVDGIDVARVRLMINDPARRSAHVQQLLELVQSHGYAGVDIDYEHLWSTGDLPGFSAFMTELSETLHSAGFELDMAINGLTSDPSGSGYSYGLLSNIVDHLHIMGYDFHYLGSSHPGPLAPLGWIEAVLAFAAQTGHADRFILGLANYGIGEGWYTTASDSEVRCGDSMSSSTDHMSSCSLGQFYPGRAPHCMTSRGELWFEDVSSMEEKVSLAYAYGAGGVTYWTIGDEPFGFFSMLDGYFPL